MQTMKKSLTGALIGMTLISCGRDSDSRVLEASINPTSSEYEQLAASQKEEVLWSDILKSEYTNLPRWTGFEAIRIVALALDPIRGMVRDFFNVTFDHRSDVLPEGRKKGIHTYGSVAKVKFVANSEAYTGLYAGADHGLLRISLAAKPLPIPRLTVPGLALKFLVDGKQSMNIFAMPSLDGIPSYNIFSATYRTQIENPKNPLLMILANAFGTASKDPTKINVFYLGMMAQNGLQVEQPNSFDRLHLTPDPAIAKRFSDSPHEFRNDLAAIEAGTRLFNVVGFKKEDPSKEYIVGHISTESRFVSSKFGDEKLFFRHQRYEDSANKE